MGNISTAAVDGLQHELDRAIDKVRRELDRIEVLLAGLGAFNQPVPDYEPGFQHWRPMMRNVVELTWNGGSER